MATFPRAVDTPDVRAIEDRIDRNDGDLVSMRERLTEFQTEMREFRKEVHESHAALHRKLDHLFSLRNQASGAHRLATELSTRVSKVEAADIEFSAQMAAAKHDGKELAEADWTKARKRILWTLSSAPVIMIVVALLAQRCS
jgi:chromosome segregation ATPase